MKSWMERLCGSVALNELGENQVPSYNQLVSPSQTLSDGGSFRPQERNQNAGMMKLKKNIVLPTDYYATMLFNQEDSAVIYSDANLQTQEDPSALESLSLPVNPKNMN